MFLLYGHKHTLANKKDLSLKDFKNEIFYTNFPKTKITNFWKKVFNYYDISVWKTEIVSNYDSALFNIGMGEGVGFLDAITLHLNEKTFAKLALPVEVSATSICITWYKKNFNPTIPLFIKLLTDAEDNRVKHSCKTEEIDFYH